MSRKRQCAMILALIMMGWFMIPLIWRGIFMIGNITGMLVFGLLACYLWQYETIKKRVGPIYRCCLYLLVTVICLVALWETKHMIHAAHTPHATGDVVLVLGCKTHGVMLRERVHTACTYLQSHEKAVAVLCGGQGRNEDMTEAQDMYEQLIASGIAKERLYKEETSTTTYENMQNACTIIKQHHLGHEVVIVTNEFHAYRALLMAQEAGLKATAFSAATHPLLLPSYYVRELYAIFYHVVLGK